MPSNEPAPSHFSAAEIDAALRDLPKTGWVRLQRIAQSLSNLYPIEAEDLLHEAFCRALDGRRRCPRHVDIFRFLGEAMKSIASDTLKSVIRHPELRLVISAGDEDGSVFDPPDERVDIEDEFAREQEAAQTKQRILDLFQDDSTARLMVEGIMEGIEGEELQELTELDKTAFASKRRLIRRRIEKAYPKGWTP